MVLRIYEGQLSKAIDELDKTLSFLGLLFSTVLIAWLVKTSKEPVYITATILFFVACSGYLFLRGRTISFLVISRTNHRLYLALNILFFFILSYSMISIQSAHEIYTRPISYFISIALMTSIVSIETLFLPPSKSCIYFAIFKIILIGLSLMSQMLIFPGVEGVDPWWHQMFTLKMLDAGHLPAEYGYSKLPLFHLMIGVTSLITGLNYEISTIFSISSMQLVVFILFIFLMGKFIFNTTVGLQAALLVGVASYRIMWSYWSIPSTIAAVLIPIILYLLFKRRKEGQNSAILLCFVLMVALILTHPLGSMWLAILLFVLWAGFEIYTRLYICKFYMPVSLTIAILFSIAMLGYWTYASGHLSELAKFIKVGFGEEAWGPGPLGTTIQYMLDIPFSERVFNNIGNFLFFAFSIVGCFYMVSKKHRNEYRFVIVLSGIVILATGFLTPLFGFEVLGGRWFYMAQIILAIPLSLGLFLVCELFKKNSVKVLIISFMVFILSFLMIMSPSANLDNHIFSPNTGVRYAFTDAELHAAETISNRWSGNIGTDVYYRMPFIYQFNAKFSVIDGCILSKDYKNCQDMLVVIRQEVVKFAFQLGGNPYRLQYDPNQVLVEQSFSHIYENGFVSGHEKV